MASHFYRRNRERYIERGVGTKQASLTAAIGVAMIAAISLALLGIGIIAIANRHGLHNGLLVGIPCVILSPVAAGMLLMDSRQRRGPIAVLSGVGVATAAIVAFVSLPAALLIATAAAVAALVAALITQNEH